MEKIIDMGVGLGYSEINGQSFWGGIWEGCECA